MEDKAEVVDNSDAVKAEMMAKLKRAMRIIGLKAESYAKDLAPVDTGLLRNSITYAIGGEAPSTQQYTDRKDKQNGQYEGKAPDDNETEITLYLGSNVHYAPYNELGHHTVSGSYVPPHPFLRPAMQDHIEEYLQVLNNET